MLPVCITDDEDAGLALHRRRLVGYVLLPNYRNYWKEAGYGEEMASIEQALAEGRRGLVALGELALETGDEFGARRGIFLGFLRVATDDIAPPGDCRLADRARRPRFL